MRAYTVNSLLKYSMWIALCLAITTAYLHAAVVCEVSTSGTPFGSFDVINHERRDTLASITVSCTGDVGELVSYTIALGPGAGTFNRKMRSGANLLRYNLYSDSARTQIWGDSTGGSAKVRGSFRISSSPTRQVYTIYGRIPNGQELAQVGAYVDSISVLVSY